jgi:membrane-associated protein
VHFDLRELVGSLGYFGVWAIIFAESGLLIGFFLPGDSLLVTAGVLSSVPNSPLNVSVLIFGCFVCAVLGDNVGYTTGYRFGRKLFDKPDSRFFKKKYLTQTQSFYEQHGKKTIVLARFLPIVRTFAPIVAGTAAMNYRIFIFFNVIGGFIWTVGVTLLGYFLGGMIPEDKVDRYLLPIILVIIIVSAAPSIMHVIKENKSSKS